MRNLCYFLKLLKCYDIIVPVIRQKGESQNGGNKKTKHAKFSEKRTFLIAERIRGQEMFVSL